MACSDSEVLRLLKQKGLDDPIAEKFKGFCLYCKTKVVEAVMINSSLPLCS